MGNCLVTKLKENVQNGELLKLGEMKVFHTTGSDASTLSLYFIEPVLITFNMPVTVTDPVNQTTQTNVTSTTQNFNSIAVPANSELIVTVSDKYKLYTLGGSLNGADLVNVKGFDYNVNLAQVSFTGEGASITGIGKFQHVSNNDYSSYPLYSIAANYSDVNGDISFFANDTDITGINIQTNQVVNVYGNIESLSRCIRLSDLVISNDNGITGDADTLFNAMVSNGRTSGSISFFKNPHVTFSASATHESNWYTIRFGSDMVNPTAEDTARGWQFV